MTDRGFSLIELLLVVVVFGVLTTVVVLSVTGIVDEADESACLADRRLLEKASEAYFAQAPADTIPAAVDADEPYEQTLVEREFLRGTSQHYDLDADGRLSAVAGSPCAV